MKLKDLCNQYIISDSVSERSRLKKEIGVICDNFMNTSYEVDGNFPEEFSDFRGDGVEFKEIDGNEIVMTYERFWGYGGHCEETCRYSIDEIDNFDKEREKKKVKEEKINNLRRKTNNAENKFLCLKGELSKLENESALS